MNTKRLLLTYFTTAVGTSVSSIAIFLIIESTFSNTHTLGMALSVKTLASFFFGFYAAYFVQFLQLRKALLASQLMGICSLLLYSIGLKYHILFIVVCGIVTSAISSSLLMVSLMSSIRSLNQTEHKFRKISGYRNAIYGFASLVASIAAPLILTKFNIFFILALDMLTFLIAFSLIFNEKNIQITNSISSHKPIKLYILKEFSTIKFILLYSSALILISLIPLVASSSKIEFSKHLPILFRKSIWSFQAITVIFSSILYSHSQKLLKTFPVRLIIFINGIFMIPLAFNQSPITVTFVVLLVSFSIFLSDQKIIDDFIVQANSPNKTTDSIAFGYAFKNFLYAISPLLLNYLLITFSTKNVIIIILTIQIVFCILAGVIKIRSSLNNDLKPSL